jgi:hypothetical protein
VSEGGAGSEAVSVTVRYFWRMGGVCTFHYCNLYAGGVGPVRECANLIINSSHRVCALRLYRLSLCLVLLPKVEESSKEALPKRPAVRHQAFGKSLCTDGVASSTNLNTTQETRTLISSSVRFDNRATLNRYKCVKHKYAGSYQLPAYSAITPRESQRSTRHAITRWYQTPVIQRGSSETQASVYALPKFLAVALMRGMMKASH